MTIAVPMKSSPVKAVNNTSETHNSTMETISSLAAKTSVVEEIMIKLIDPAIQKYPSFLRYKGDNTIVIGFK
jgi:hypothetical protein